MNERKGRLILIGGNEDKRRDFVILKSVLESEAGGTVAVIPTASDYPKSVGRSYESVFNDLGAETVTVVDVRTREEAQMESAIHAIQDAQIIFFTGGDQVKLVKTLEKTPLFDAVVERLANGATVAGTSAGAAAAGDITIYSGDDSGCKKGAIRHTRGFGLLSGITIDSHFYARGRMPRLIQHIAARDNRRGIGIGEDTAIVIQPDNTFEVIGRHLVMCLDGTTIRSSNYDIVEPGEHLSVDGITIACLSSGSRFDMNRWEMAVTWQEVPAGEKPTEQREAERIRERLNS